MDLYAYAQIGILSGIAEKNGISIPRLRGYRLMSEEEPYTNEEIAEFVKDRVGRICEEGCTSIPRWRPHSNMSVYDSHTDKLRKKYVIYGKDSEGYKCPVDLRWGLIHGKNRKAMKLAVKRAAKEARAYCEMRNKYAGRKDVLCAHSRIGGGNWNFYGGDDLLGRPWFIEKIDDPFDNTYCDIYCKIAVE